MDNRKEISLSTEYLKNLYEKSNEVEKNLLERMYGMSLFRPDKAIMERIKTFNDACDELGKHQFVLEYKELYNDTHYETTANIAFTKLKIIAKALNGQCNLEMPIHKRWYPRFTVMKANAENEKKLDSDMVWIKRNDIYFIFYDMFGNTDLVSESSNINTSFRTKELAEYAGKQFIDIYADLIL